MDLTNQLLQVSAKLYQLLSDIPKGDERDSYIESINKLLDERGEVIKALQTEGFQINPEIKTHSTLIQLDKGIRNRLQLVMDEVKKDLKDLQNVKKHERQYMNPYESVRVMDGMYYDKKK
ncbi:MAG: flagellar protein FliT [Lysinibacillus sp.]|nr:flagellar protein FliT [Lysinibacillus sp.]